jgi:hypothetical protein
MFNYIFQGCRSTKSFNYLLLWFYIFYLLLLLIFYFALFFFVSILLATLFYYSIKHIMNFFKYKGKWPCKNIHVSWQEVRMMSIVKLFHIEMAIFDFYDSTFIVIDITVIRGTKYCNYWWKIFSSIPFMKFIACLLYFMSSNHTDYLILL